MGLNTGSGRGGEEAAAKYLVDEGYRVVERNWHCRYGEIDIIAEGDGYLCFVEVKTRSGEDFALPREFVTAAKQRKCRLAASMYLAANPTLYQPRFDVVEVYTGKHNKIIHIDNAF